MKLKHPHFEGTSKVFFRDAQGKETSLDIKEGIINVDSKDTNTVKIFKDEGFTEVGENDSEAPKAPKSKEDAE